MHLTFTHKTTNFGYEKLCIILTHISRTQKWLNSELYTGIQMLPFYRLF